MIKNYVLDTNVLLLDPDAMFKFEDNNVIIPIGVIEELDKFKRDLTELGKNARHVSRALDILRQEGDLRDGVKVGKGKLMVRYNGNLQSYYKETNVDLHVIHIAQKLVEQEPDIPCVIISRDINVRIRANALGFKAEGYESDRIPHSEIDCGYSEVIIEVKLFENLVSGQSVDLSSLAFDFDIYPNHYLVVHREGGGPKSGLLARIDRYGEKVNKILTCPSGVGLKSKNKEQSFVLDALLDDDIKLVCIAGKAGSGKTIISVAVGYYLVVQERRYKRLLVSRPVFPMGRDIGYLPGDIGEKLDPWMTPIYDAFDVIKHDKEVSGRHLVDGRLH